MIAKLIVYGERRQRALQQMQAVIDETVIDGIKTNLDLLIEILQAPAFQRLTTTVNWLDDQMNPNQKEEQDDEDRFKQRPG
jgi:acetyl-CoA carboxylase, biotin carboxylase subunit